MAKMRGFKPEIWTDEKFVELQPLARLLFMGLWTYACDNGHLQDRSKTIKLRVLPVDNCNASELLDEIARIGLIQRADGWITIPRLSHHQRIDKRFFRTCERDDCEPPDAQRTDPERETRRVPTASTRVPAVVTSGPRDEGEGEGERKVKTPPAEPGTFLAFWDAYDKKAGRRAAVTAYTRALTKPGVTAALLIAAASEYVEWQKGNGKHPEFTKDPSTWLNGEHWNDERSARQTARPKTRLDGFRDVQEQLLAREAAQHAPPSGLRELGSTW